MTKSITLVTNFETGETKEFFQPEHIKGSVALEGLTLAKQMEKKGYENIEASDVRKVATFVSDKLYGDSFTVDEMIDGIHANNILTEVMTQLSSVLGGDSGNATKAKKR